MRIVTLEEHFVTEDFLNVTGAFSAGPPEMQVLRAKLLDLGAERLAAMDAAAIDVQVLSLAAVGFETLDGPTGTSAVRDANDVLAAAVKDAPTRFAGLASLGVREPENAAKELERAVATLGFKGAIVNGTSGGGFLDEARFAPVLEVAVALDVPIYLHPAPPMETVKEAYFSGLPGRAGEMLSMAGWGWHAETGLHVLRMIAAGVFDRLPALKIIIGHMGENLPFSLARADTVLGTGTKHLKRGVAETFHENFWVTTSGYFTAPPFLCALQVVGADRMMFSVDYPFSAMETGRQFLEALAVSPTDRGKIAAGNADALLKL